MSDSLDGLISRIKTAASPLRTMLSELHAKYRPLTDGQVTDHIPELALADPEWFAICLVTADGQAFEVGDHARPFAIQAASRPFVYGLTLEDHGLGHVLSRVGAEPRREGRDAAILDEASSRPFNPLVSAGAIAAADLVAGKDLNDRAARLLTTFRRYCGREVQIDSSIFFSERAAGANSRSTADFMLSLGTITHPVEETLELYFQAGSVLVSCRDLAVMGACLANRGVNPLTGELALEERQVKHVLSVMYTCGIPGDGGEWACKVGLPAMGGASGGLVAVVPGQAGIAVFSPRLDARGVSARGVKVCEELSEAFGLHVFGGGSGGRLQGALKPARGV